MPWLGIAGFFSPTLENFPLKTFFHSQFRLLPTPRCRPNSSFQQQQLKNGHGRGPLRLRGWRCEIVQLRNKAFLN